MNLLNAEAITQGELSQAFRIVLRLRIAGSIALLVLASLYAVYDPVPWKIILPCATSLMLVGFTVRDRKYFGAVTFRPAAIAKIMATVLFAHSVMMFLTGGIQSPFIVIFPVLTTLVAVGITRRALHLTFLLLPIAVVWTFALVDITDAIPGLLPAVLENPGGGGASPVYVVSLAIFLTIVMILGGTMGMLTRGAFDRAAQATFDAQHQAIHTAQERKRELIALSGALAHELKNPLASIGGLAGLVARKQAVGTDAREQMEVLVGEVERMNAIIQEFLNFSRPVAALKLEDVALDELLAGVVTLHTAAALESQVNFQVLGCCTPIRCDARKVTQILLNLVQNALDATPPGGTVSLEMSTLSNGMAQVSIIDNGPGLADAVRGRLFTAGASTKVAGSGLGLTIARTIAEQHGGSLALEERDEGGCAATLQLPQQPPERAHATDMNITSDTQESRA